MSNITLRQLRYFEALVQQGHFGRAAAVCAVTQPALSVQIRDLEDTMGAALFERGAKQVRLTNFGVEMQTRVRDILRAVDELEDLARSAKDRLVGRFRIGVIPTIAPYLLPGIIRSLAARHPDLSIHVRETVTPNLLRDLADGKLDTALLALPVSEPSLTEYPLFSEAFVLVRPGQDAGQPVPGPEALRDMRLLLLEEGHCFRDQALSFCNMSAAAPREVMDGSSLSTLVQMVHAGIGVTLVPEMALSVETRSVDVAVARFAEPQPSRRIGMVWRKTSPMAAQLEDVAALVQEAARALNSELPSIRS